MTSELGGFAVQIAKVLTSGHQDEGHSRFLTRIADISLSRILRQVTDEQRPARASGIHLRMGATTVVTSTGMNRR